MGISCCLLDPQTNSYRKRRPKNCLILLIIKRRHNHGARRRVLHRPDRREPLVRPRRCFISHDLQRHRRSRQGVTRKQRNVIGHVRAVSGKLLCRVGHVPRRQHIRLRSVRRLRRPRSCETQSNNSANPIVFTLISPSRPHPQKSRDKSNGWTIRSTHPVRFLASAPLVPASSRKNCPSRAPARPRPPPAARPAIA